MFFRTFYPEHYPNISTLNACVFSVENERKEHDFDRKKSHLLWWTKNLSHHLSRVCVSLKHDEKSVKKIERTALKKS